MVDAEHSHFQPAIDALCLRLQQRHNRFEPVILNTYQACPAPESRRSSKDRLPVTLTARACPLPTRLCLVFW